MTNILTNLDLLVIGILLIACLLNALDIKGQMRFLKHLKNAVIELQEEFSRLPNPDRAEGLARQAIIKSAIAAKLSDRSFSLASSANVAIMALQKTLATRQQYVPKQQQLANEIAQKTVMETVGGTADYSGFDWMYPILSDEERDLLDKAMDHSQKYGETKLK